MSREKFCPIRAAAWRVVNGDADIPNEGFCVKNKCAWWSESSGCCCILDISQNIDNIDERLDANDE